MKRFLFVQLLMMLFASHAYSDTPDHDPLTAQLRAVFSAAMVPDVTGINFDKEWECVNHSTAPGMDYTLRTYKLKFFSVGGILFLRHRESTEAFLRTTSAYTRTERSRSSIGYTHIRITAANELIMETANNITALTSPSLVDPAFNATHYTICKQPRDLNSY
jgi:hypothetical protein